MPAPGIKTFPTTTSSIRIGSNLVYFNTDLNTCANISSGLVQLRPPFLALVRGVHKAETITTSVSFLIPGELKIFFF